MTKKTRIRAARIAACAVIAAGASLTAAGAASALDINVGVTLDGPTPTASDTGIPTSPPPSDSAPTSQPPTTPPPSESAPATTEPTDGPTDPTEEPTEPTDPTDEPTDGAGTGGNDSNPDGGSKPVEQGKGSSGLTDTGSDTSAQGKSGELAETGAAETTFLLVGAATMIAGGIGFRLLPRLMSGRGAAA
ncbi:hypothetical protein ACFVTC_10505 [Streptomyces sp. NPDC057950]|uniref:hypothetical protein n=1 Tax=Streptomyces sp. NPDC057950 TaxID=3346288 RepID=UPI0036E3F919